MSDIVAPKTLDNALISARYIQVGDCCFDQTSRKLYSASGETLLEPRIADLLVTLVGAGTSITRSGLLDTVSGDEGSDEALTQAISRLRRAMNDTARPYKIITTVPKGGYQVAVDVMELAALPNEFVDSVDQEPVTTTWVSRQREFLFGIVVGSAATLLVITAWIITHPPMQINETIEYYPGSTNAECQVAPSSLAE